jgi:glycosyltransferase involved in cell wall biosynthesis
MSNILSVVVPVHGEARFLPEAIASVQQQTFREFELVIVLDRPADETRSVIASLENDFGVKILESNRPGISAALNQGISSTNSKYIARLDSDDLMQPTRLQLQVSAMERNPNLSCLGSQVEYIDELGKNIGRSNLPTSSWQIKSMMPNLNCIMHPSVMMRRAALVSVGGYREYLDGVEDYNLWLRLLSSSSLENRKEYLTKYRRHTGQVTQQNSSLYPWLDSLARLDAMGYQDLKGSRISSGYLKSLEGDELESVIRKLETDTASPRIRNRLQSSRSFSLYFVGPKKDRFQNLAKSLVRTPLRTLWLSILVLVQKLKSP